MNREIGLNPDNILKFIIFILRQEATSTDYFVRPSICPIWQLDFRAPIAQIIDASSSFSLNVLEYRYNWPLHSHPRSFPSHLEACCCIAAPGVQNIASSLKSCFATHTWFNKPHFNLEDASTPLHLTSHAGCFSLKFWIFLNTASSAPCAVFLPALCVYTHTDTEGEQRKARVRNIFKSLEKTQYLINTL